MSNLHWRKFGDEFPSERRALVMAFDDGGIIAWNIAECDEVAWDLSSAEDCVTRLHASDTEEWRQVCAVFGFTHWAYITTPEAT